MTIITRGEIDGGEASAVLALAAAASAADGVSPLSEQVLLHVRYGGDAAASNLLQWRDGTLAGFAHLGPADRAGGRSGELVVHPRYRRQGLGGELAAAAVSGAGALPVRFWAHGDLPAAAALAGTARFTRARALWRMLRERQDMPDMPPLPAGVTLRSFVPGRDEKQWLALNARAFADHPEQGTWTREDLDHREREAWFDPAGFILAERDGRLAGFHWTKIHQPDGGGNGTGQAAEGAVGEVYVLGVDPAEQGTGLGRALAVAGLRHLSARGVPAVMLYVEADNVPAVRLYESLGFRHTTTDVMYAHNPAQSPVHS